MEKSSFLNHSKDKIKSSINFNNGDILDTLYSDTCRSFCQNQIEIDLLHRTLFGTIDDNDHDHDHDVFHLTVDLKLEQEPLCISLSVCACVYACVSSKFRNKLVLVVVHNAQGQRQPPILHSYRYWKHGIRYALHTIHEHALAHTESEQSQQPQCRPFPKYLPMQRRKRFENKASFYSIQNIRLILIA